MHSELMISSARRPRLVAQWGGPHMLMTVMAPRRAGEPRLVMRSTPVERAFYVDIERPDGVDTIIAAWITATSICPAFAGSANWRSSGAIQPARSPTCDRQWIAVEGSVVNEVLQSAVMCGERYFR